MNPHTLLLEDHRALRLRAEELKALIPHDLKALTHALSAFQTDIQKHFRREDAYYRVLDNDKRVHDRGLMHQLRNDHAAVIFSLESLLIRLRKNGVNDEWRAKFDKMMDVFLPHLDTEEKQLFAQGEASLSAAELAHIAGEMTRDD